MIMNAYQDHKIKTIQCCNNIEDSPGLNKNDKSKKFYSRINLNILIYDRSTLEMLNQQHMESLKCSLLSQY